MELLKPKKWYAKGENLLYVLTIERVNLELRCETAAEETSFGESILAGQFLENEEWQKLICNIYGSVALKEIWQHVLNAQIAHEKESLKTKKISAKFHKDTPLFLLGHHYKKELQFISESKFNDYKSVNIGMYSELSNDISVGITRHINVNSNTGALEKRDVNNDPKGVMSDYGCYYEPIDCQNISKEYFEELWNLAKYPNA